MPGDDHARGEDQPRFAAAFDQYSDDTPRALYDPAAAPFGHARWDDERAFAPAPDVTGTTQAPPRRRPLLLASLCLLGVTLAVAGGMLLQRGRVQAPPQAAPPPMKAVQVQVRTPAEADATAQVPGATLPTYPPAQIALNAAPAVAAAAPPAPRTSPIVPRYVDPAASAPAAPRARDVERPERADVQTTAPLQASFDCRRARSIAEQAVCGDPELAAADRRMGRAYRAALAVDPDPGDLRAEQSDWIEVRENAARRGPDALMSIYRQRIADLRSLADDPPD